MNSIKLKPKHLKATFIIAKHLITILLNFQGCQCLSFIQGKEANLNFPYPCNSTEVTLQQSQRRPFYHLTNRSSLSLPDDQIHRFTVQNRTINGNCSLELTIRNLMKSDVGTYLSSIYRDGKLIDKLTTRHGLQLEYPPGKATCVKEEDKGGNWEAIKCTADVGSISGKIECYQKGEKMPSLTNPVETSITLTEIILIRKSEPAFCCSSALDEYKPECECNDTVLNLPDDGSTDPCPTPSPITTMPYVYNVTENNSTNHLSTMISSTSMGIKEQNCILLIMHSTFVPIEVTILIVSLFLHYKMKTKTKTKDQN